MNKFQIGAQRVPGGFIGWFRKVHKASNEIIKAKGGNPIVYPTKDAARAAAGDAMVAYINGSLVRDGETIGANKADAAFPALKPFIRQGGKVIPVEQRRARA